MIALGTQVMLLGGCSCHQLKGHIVHGGLTTGRTAYCHLSQFRPFGLWCTRELHSSDEIIMMMSRKSPAGFWRLALYTNGKSKKASYTANRSRVSIRSRPCKNLPHTWFDHQAEFVFFSHTVCAHVESPKK